MEVEEGDTSAQQVSAPVVSANTTGGEYIGGVYQPPLPNFDDDTVGAETPEIPPDRGIETTPRGTTPKLRLDGGAVSTALTGLGSVPRTQQTSPRVAAEYAPPVESVPAPFNSEGDRPEVSRPAVQVQPQPASPPKPKLKP